MLDNSMSKWNAWNIFTTQVSMKGATWIVNDHPPFWKWTCLGLKRAVGFCQERSNVLLRQRHVLRGRLPWLRRALIHWQVQLHDIVVKLLNRLCSNRCPGTNNAAPGSAGHLLWWRCGYSMLQHIKDYSLRRFPGKQWTGTHDHDHDDDDGDGSSNFCFCRHCLCFLYLFANLLTIWRPATLSWTSMKTIFICSSKP